MWEEPEIAIVGTKGQIVIPQRLRKELEIKPNTKLCVYRKDDKLVIMKLKVPPLADLEELFKEIDERRSQKKKPSDEEILEEIQAYRREKKTKQGR